MAEEIEAASAGAASVEPADRLLLLFVFRVCFVLVFLVCECVCVCFSSSVFLLFLLVSSFHSSGLSSLFVVLFLFLIACIGATMIVSLVIVSVIIVCFSCVAIVACSIVMFLTIVVIRAILTVIVIPRMTTTMLCYCFHFCCSQFHADLLLGELAAVRAFFSATLNRLAHHCVYTRLECTPFSLGYDRWYYRDNTSVPHYTYLMWTRGHGRAPSSSKKGTASRPPFGADGSSCGALLGFLS